MSFVARTTLGRATRRPCGRGRRGRTGFALCTNCAQNPESWCKVPLAPRTHGARSRRPCPEKGPGAGRISVASSVLRPSLSRRNSPARRDARENAWLGTTFCTEPCPPARCARWPERRRRSFPPNRRAPGSGSPRRIRKRPRSTAAPTWDRRRRSPHGGMARRLPPPRPRPLPRSKRCGCGRAPQRGRNRGSHQCARGSTPNHPLCSARQHG
mmetsp:Transcript_28826/g.79450  ORF Transcript_28826/g.79450 Transcript_28826/m.79450 type:complete len:212 (+) Transcript_28826:160-795(+)